jgi:ferredoxin
MVATQHVVPEVDRQRCVGHALCASFAPDVYVLDDLGYNVTEAAPIPTAQVSAARRGAEACPERAIRLVARDEVAAPSAGGE